MKCRHCQRNRVCRPRGLCWNCFYKPGVRDLYPSTARPIPKATFLKSGTKGKAGAEVSEKGVFLAMLERAGIGHGLSGDHKEVQVEHDGDDGFFVTHWLFDDSGNLVAIEHCEGIEG